MILYILIVSNAVFGIYCALLIRKNGSLKMDLRRAISAKKSLEFELKQWKARYEIRRQMTITQEETELQKAWLLILQYLFPPRR